MSDPAFNEIALQADIEELRKRYPDTKDLYREAAILLFFRHGQTPTTNRLYQLVRKGSMNTVTASLSAFWETLRERSRVQINHPTIPEELKSAAGDLVQVIWDKANVSAKVEFAAATAESIAKIDAAQRAQAEAEVARDRSFQENTVLAAKSQSISESLTESQAAIDAEKRAHGETAARLEEARAEVISLRDALSQARRDFAIELDKGREAITLAEERLAATERRALLEIDRERTLRADAEKETNRQRAAVAALDAKSSARAQADAEELGQLRGKFQAIESDLTKRNEEIEQLRKQVSTLETIIARSEGEATASRGYLLKLEDALKWTAVEHSQSAAHVALRTFNDIAGLWKLTDAEVAGVLSAESFATVTDWRKGLKPIPADVVSRISDLTEIYKALQSLYSDKAVADSWLRQKNTRKHFGGIVAMDLMTGGVDGVTTVLRYVESKLAEHG